MNFRFTEPSLLNWIVWSESFEPNLWIESFELIFPAELFEHNIFERNFSETIFFGTDSLNCFFWIVIFLLIVIWVNCSSYNCELLWMLCANWYWCSILGHPYSLEGAPNRITEKPKSQVKLFILFQLNWSIILLCCYWTKLWYCTLFHFYFNNQQILLFILIQILTFS